MVFFAWNFVVRKLEEDDMETKFGKEFTKYKASVKCWIPSLKKHPKQ